MDNILISDSIVNKEKFHNFIRAVLRINLFNMSTLLSEVSVTFDSKNLNQIIFYVFFFRYTIAVCEYLS